MSKQSTLQAMQAMAEGIDNLLNGDERPKKTGFVLLVFPFGGLEGMRTNYVSNANRHDVKEALREIVDRFDQQTQMS